MASVHKDGNGFRIAWADGSKRRRRIRIQGLSKRQAESLAGRIQLIVGAQISGQAIDSSTATWLAGIGDAIHGKLADAGLVERRDTSTLNCYLAHFVNERKDTVAWRTVRNWQTTVDKLIEFFGNRELRTITENDAESWRRWLVKPQSDGKRFSQATVSGHTKRAKQFFQAAAKAKLIESNPFADIKAGSQANEERKRYVPTSDVERVMDKAIDSEWRLLIALSRYAGLRTPSESLNLKWQDIDWESGRMSVTSPKTAKQGKGSRVVPITPELRVRLDEAFAQANDGAIYCIERYRSQDVNLRTQLIRTIKAAGLEPWPRTWHNLRASFETDLTQRFPLHVAAKWLGHTPAVAQAHYLTVVDSDFDKAAGEGLLPRVGQGVGQKLHATNDRGGNGSQRFSRLSRENKGNDENAESDEEDKARPVGFEDNPTALGLRWNDVDFAL